MEKYSTGSSRRRATVEEVRFYIYYVMYTYCKLDSRLERLYLFFVFENKIIIAHFLTFLQTKITWNHRGLIVYYSRYNFSNLNICYCLI